LSQQTEICFDTETTGINALTAEIIGMSFCFKKNNAYYVPLLGTKAETMYILNLFNTIFQNPHIHWIGQNIKYDLLILKNYNITIKGVFFDTMLAHYVIEPESRHNMDLISTQLLKYEPVSIETLIGKKGKQQLSMRDAPLEKVKEYAAEDADITFQIKQKLAPQLKEKGVEKVFWEVENPLIHMLIDMEYQGIKIDVDFLKNYSNVLEKECKEFEESVYKQAGVRFNLSSPKQLGEVLFDKLQIKADAKKTKTGQYATGEDVIQKLAKQHPIVEDILNFRELSKLKSTYIDAIPELINPRTGRVHTSFSQAVAVTGRLSSNNPNLQNIPIRTQRGKEIRKAFIPSTPDRFIISADYSQIELRIVAAISGDKNLCNAFIDGKDIHTATASKVFKITEEEVTKEQRYKAKSVNFGIIYGQGAFGLAENLGISRSEAKEIIDNYKQEFPAIQEYMQMQINKAKELGYVETLMGRKRWLADINSSNFTVRGFAERNAINSPIQGSAADMIKLAMIHIFKTFNDMQIQSKMILQVHDELLFDVIESEIEQVKKIILQEMIHALPLPNNVPVEASLGIGKNWLEAH
ncbi:MAG: DNA polymerase I, partial [Sediminibacterium sp.]|nr:DNA polymerase I [Sediminibacterium sp.]